MLCSLALGAAGCGGPEPADERTTQDVTRAVRAYYDAFAAVDGRRLCATLVADAREDDCVRSAERTAEAVPDELRAELREVDVTGVEVDGDEATATLELDSELASEPRRITVGLAREDGEWRLSELPEDERDSADPLTTCFASGMEAFEDEQADPYWRREGRADFAFYLRETCTRAVERGIVRENAGELSPEQRERFQAVAGEVLREMIAAGRVRKP